MRERWKSLMSHLHVPDGVLPLWLVLAGWAVTIVVVALALRALGGSDARRRVPIVGALAALMLVAMSSEVVPIAYHINLTVVAGILLGPALSVITAIVVVSVLALIGHGGVTVIGLNVVVIATEMVLGGLLFRAFERVLNRKRPALVAGAATVLTLLVTTTMVVGIVALGGTRAATRESGAFDPQQLRFENPFAEGVLGSELVGEEEPEPEPGQGDIGRFALTVYILGSIGWLLEGAVTGGIVGFVAKVRPSLVWSGAVAGRERHRLGDEGIHR